MDQSYSGNPAPASWGKLIIHVWQTTSAPLFGLDQPGFYVIS